MQELRRNHVRTSEKPEPQNFNEYLNLPIKAGFVLYAVYSFSIRLSEIATVNQVENHLRGS